MRILHINTLWAVHKVAGLLTEDIFMSKYSFRRSCMKVVLVGVDIRCGSFLQLETKDLEVLSPISIEMGA